MKISTKINKKEVMIREVIKQIKKDFGIYADPFKIHEPIPELLASVWAACRETELVGILPRSIKELIAVHVSKSNSCTYCVDAHEMLLYSVGKKELVELETQDETLNTEEVLFAKWARLSRNPKDSIVEYPLFTMKQASEAIGIVVYFHYLNRMVHLFLEDTLIPLRQSKFKSLLQSLAGFAFSRRIKKEKKIGDSLHFLPANTLPSDMQWAISQSHIATAFAQFNSSINQLKNHYIPISVQQVMEKFWSEWNGEEAPLGFAWMEKYLHSVDSQHQDILKLSILLTMSPYRVTKDIVKEFEVNHEDSKLLLATAAWASFNAAKRIGSWLDKSYKKSHK